MKKTRMNKNFSPMDSLTVDETLVNELEAGQEEAYEGFQRAARKARADEANLRKEKIKDLKAWRKRTWRDIVVTAIYFLFSIVMWIECLFDMVSVSYAAGLAIMATMVALLYAGRHTVLFLLASKEIIRDLDNGEDDEE